MTRSASFLKENRENSEVLKQGTLKKAIVLILRMMELRMVMQNQNITLIGGTIQKGKEVGGEEVEPYQ